MSTSLLVLATIILTFSLQAGAHGTDKLGPHGGYIQMPGAYHTEVVPTAKNELQVYLLDINWKNPTTQNSSVNLVLPPLKNLRVMCLVQEEKYFACKLPKQFKMNQDGKLIVQSKREGQTGNDAVYALPLRLEPMTGMPSEKPETSEHSGHSGH